MKGYKKFICLTAVLVLMLCTAASLAETPAEETEQGVEELQQMLEINDVGNSEGMSLEEMTDAFTESAMSEYMDSTTGFSMQYPSVFQFDEEQGGSIAFTSDGKAMLSIDNMAGNESGLDEKTLEEAIRFENPDAMIQKNEQNGCMRVDRITDGGKTEQTDLYLLTEHSLHHIILRYPAEEQETYFSYIEYMINTMETSGSDLG